MYIYCTIDNAIRRPLQSVERVRLQPSKSTMLFNIQAQAARQQQAAQDDPCLQQPRLDGAKSDQLFFIGATARCKQVPQAARA